MMVSYSSAVNTENKEYINTFMCSECNDIKKGKEWVNYDNDNKCICSYLCYKSKSEKENIWDKINNKEDFNYPMPIQPKKEEEFAFLTNFELMEFTDIELKNYYIKLNEYYMKDPERARLQMDILDESEYFSDTEESEYDSDEYYYDYME